MLGDNWLGSNQAKRFAPDLMRLLCLQLQPSFNAIFISNILITKSRCYTNLYKTAFDDERFLKA